MNLSIAFNVGCWGVDFNHNQILMQKATINASICNQRDEERWKEIGGKKTLIDRVKRELGI
ncbi:hypothetical protein ES288_D05G281300v1 [Gossypium darwinii]|uniref:Uncharacterized protein n=1 Tax=Gossypium darwinii TaxID=34276 RepID=A0A5D2CP02_GOSDA|nr:hypothetical protein ES288_D05G281300v1 [Gossypium darwinii]